MIPTSTPIQTPHDDATGSDIPLHPTDILMHLIVALLAPMFLSVTGGDITHARMAAIETVNAYRARNLADLLAITQIIAFGLAALGSLSLSMAEDMSLAMILRLRANANALNRSAEQNRRALRETANDDPMPQHAAIEAEPESRTVTKAGHDAAEAMANPASPSHAQADIPTPKSAADPATATIAAEQRHQAMWAIAVVKEAGEITASTPDLPQAERRAAAIRAAALGSAANELLTGASTPKPPRAATPHPAQPNTNGTACPRPAGNPAAALRPGEAIAAAIEPPTAATEQVDLATPKDPAHTPVI